LWLVAVAVAAVTEVVAVAVAVTEQHQDLVFLLQAVLILMVFIPLLLAAAALALHRQRIKVVLGRIQFFLALRHPAAVVVEAKAIKTEQMAALEVEEQEEELHQTVLVVAEIPH